jgi:hypothetical protein
VLTSESDASKYKEAVSILRNAQLSVPKSDIQLSSRLSLALAKALMISGDRSETSAELRESISLIGEMLKFGDPTLHSEATNNLGIVYYLLGLAEDEVSDFKISRDILSTLTEGADSIIFPFVRAQSQQGVGRALREIGRIERSSTIIHSR